MQIFCDSFEGALLPATVSGQFVRGPGYDWELRMIAAAVASIFDPSTPDYDYLPFFYSRIFDLGWQVLRC
jgi:hypothetical protein